MQAFGGVAFGQGGVWRLGDFAAVALWLPPGTEPGGDATVALFQATVDSRKFNDLLGVFGQMEEAHPAMPHWYLPWFGVDCALQGRGLGSRLMTPCLEIVDQQHMPAYLDSTNPRNVPSTSVMDLQSPGSARPVTVPRSSPCSGNVVSRTYSSYRSLPQTTCRSGHWWSPSSSR